MHSASLIPFLRFVAGGFLNNQLRDLVVAILSHTWYKFCPANSLPFFPNPLTRAMFNQTHNVRPRSREFIEARVLGFSWTPAATMQKPAFIASPLRRQYEPEVKGAIWRAREVDLIAVQ